ncbi:MULTISPECIES: DUF4383 domain-containing protein [Streptomyces]|uniref:DUF4383 domain-containing protein n=1 Tax=Streptomyces TaxID=1883 RepID=UPI00080556CF|nr:DUF4383 domain-containing protein [Streptomyces sp. SID4925]SBU88925.1 protein of unknown function (DUF4383) [Streptomyces sp. OspMP-M45]
MVTHVPHPHPTRAHARDPGRRPARSRWRRGAIRLDEQLPVDHRLSRVYRIGAGLMGLFLIAFGILGLIDRIGFFDTGGDTVAGLNTNGTLSVLSICIGLLLFVGRIIGGNFASTLNTVLGVAFILSGFVNLALLDTSMNFLAFHMQNVIFSFLVGLLLMTFGMYGRVSGGLPHDNPYWRARHPEQVARDDDLPDDLRAELRPGPAPLEAPPETGPEAPPEASPGRSQDRARKPGAWRRRRARHS